MAVSPTLNVPVNITFSTGTNTAGFTSALAAELGKASYDDGFTEGREYERGEWENALEEVLPDNIEVEPGAVTEWIKSLLSDR